MTQRRNADRRYVHIIPVSTGWSGNSGPQAECRECQVSCQSACKTSCTVGNQKCERPVRA